MTSIPFSEFMSHALYDPIEGYYSHTPAIGRKGDFFTSVSVGSSLGQILAYQALEAWEALGYPEPFHLIEQGAHDGTLMVDLLEELKLLQKSCFDAVEVVLIEPLLSSRQLQAQKIRAIGLSFRHYSHWGEVEKESLTGFFYSNELIDSFPVDLVTYQEGEWYEKRVLRGKEKGDYSWELKKIIEEEPDFSLLKIIPEIEGYTTEIHRRVDPWLQSVFQGLKSGVVLIIDYGYPQSFYYSRERVSGTLQMYRNHQKSVDPFLHVGEQDITSHVNFTLLHQSALRVEAELIGYTDQGRYLTGMGERWLCEIAEIHPADSAVFQKKIREFKTLTHPEMMGGQFKVMGLGKKINEEKTWKGFRFGSTIPL